MESSTPILFAFGNVASMRLQLILARRVKQMGSAVSFLHWGSADDALCTEIGDLGPIRTLPEVEARAGQPWGRVGMFLDYHRRKIDAAAAVIRDVAPRAIVVSEDGISGDLHFLAAAKRLGVRLVDVPYGFNLPRDLEADIQEKVTAGEVYRAEGRMGFALRLLAPRWIKRGNYAGTLMLPPDYTLAAVLAGIRLRDAWFVHGGMADVLCAEGPRSIAKYLEAGVPRRNLNETGSPYADEMAASVREHPAALAALRKPQRIDPSHTKLLVSWGPSYHERRPGLNEFADYEQMTNSILTRLRDIAGLQLTVSLHPACGPEVRRLLTDWNVPMTDEYVIRAMPKHDLFLSFFSSTIRWAKACGKPVLNYDAYDWGLTTFNGPAFASFRRADDLIACAAKFASSVQAYEEVAAIQCRVAAEEGPLDGLSCSRIYSVINGAGRS